MINLNKIDYNYLQKQIEPVLTDIKLKIKIDEFFRRLSTELNLEELSQLEHVIQSIPPDRSNSRSIVTHEIIQSLVREVKKNKSSVNQLEQVSELIDEGRFEEGIPLLKEMKKNRNFKNAILKLIDQMVFFYQLKGEDKKSNFLKNYFNEKDVSESFIEKMNESVSSLQKKLKKAEKKLNIERIHYQKALETNNEQIIQPAFLRKRAAIKKVLMLNKALYQAGISQTNDSETNEKEDSSEKERVILNRHHFGDILKEEEEIILKFIEKVVELDEECLSMAIQHRLSCKIIEKLGEKVEETGQFVYRLIIEKYDENLILNFINKAKEIEGFTFITGLKANLSLNVLKKLIDKTNFNPSSRENDLEEKKTISNYFEDLILLTDKEEIILKFIEKVVINESCLFIAIRYQLSSEIIEKLGRKVKVKEMGKCVRDLIEQKYDESLILKFIAKATEIDGFTFKFAVKAHLSLIALEILIDKTPKIVLEFDNQILNDLFFEKNKEYYPNWAISTEYELNIKNKYGKDFSDKPKPYLPESVNYLSFSIIKKILNKSFQLPNLEDVIGFFDEKVISFFLDKGVQVNPSSALPLILLYGYSDQLVLDILDQYEEEELDPQILELAQFRNYSRKVLQKIKQKSKRTGCVIF